MKTTPKFLREIETTDSQGNIVHIAVFEDVGGGLFAVDSSFLSNTDEPVYNPFDGSEIDEDVL